MKAKDLLQQLQLGNSVAEFDTALERYFVETETFRSLVNDQVDIVAGDKGTGKTALYQILSQRASSLAELHDVQVIPGFNPAGSPIFQRLAEGDVLQEGEYITIWKAYLLALVGNWLLEFWAGSLTPAMLELEKLLDSTKLRTKDDSPIAVFTGIVNLFRRLSNPKSVEISFSANPQGIPVVIPKATFDTIDTIEDASGNRLIRHDDALGLLNRALMELDLRVWVVLDRLDEAFQGFPSAEIPALRALLRTYLDLSAFSYVKLKLFVRRDLFRRIIAGGFVNLTHVNARKMEIVWDEDDLWSLLSRRVRENGEFLNALGIDDEPSGTTLFQAIFPTQVDVGKRKSTTWKWFMSRIRDGNGVRPPRNLIDLAKKAQEAQIRREENAATDFTTGIPLIGSDSIKRGLRVLSTERVSDTLLAEAADLAPSIERFRGGKAEHNEESLAQVLGGSAADRAATIKRLGDIGFLEPVGTTYKVPALYRDGLDITQGKAFALGDQSADEDDE